jgi:signal transduction histidine kinase
MRKSLTSRIIFLSVFWIVFALLATALLLGRLYREHIEEHYDAHVFTHVEELVAAIETSPEGDWRLHSQPTDPRFHRPNSGWYWEVLDAGGPLEKSPSLGEYQLDLTGLAVSDNHGAQTVYGPNQQKLRAHVIHAIYPDDSGSLTFVATAPVMQITDDVQDFIFDIFMSFLVLGIGLSVAVVVQVQVALKPLKAIRSAISDVQVGKTERLPQEFPSDVQPLVNELNFLLDHNELLLKRARNQLGDLAHAVKNPLSVIRNEARSMESKQGQLILDQSHVMAGSIDHCLSRARIYGKKDAIGYRTSVKSVIKDLAYAVRHIYQDRGIEVHHAGLDDHWFRGDAQDLEEMAGNLIDNACKWAKTQVVVKCVTNQSRLVLAVDDDGPGIAEKDMKDVMQRGHKLDESHAGHGQGLGIVKDIADLYNGTLKLSRSPLGGLRAELDLPAASVIGTS